MGGPVVVIAGGQHARVTAQETAIDVTIFGEPPTLDPVLYTSDSSSIISTQTLVAKQNFETVGFAVEIWASVMQIRTNPDQWEGFIAHWSAPLGLDRDEGDH